MVADRAISLSGLGFLHKVKRTCVSAGDFAALGEDEFEEFASFMLGAERGADVVEFVNLRVGEGEFVAGFAPGLHQVHVIDGVVEHALKQGSRRVRWQICVDRAVKARVAEALIGEHNDARVGAAQRFQVLGKKALIGNDENICAGKTRGFEGFKAGVLNALTLLYSGARKHVGLKVNCARQLAAAGGQDNVFRSGHPLKPSAHADRRNAMERI